MIRLLFDNNLQKKLFGCKVTGEFLFNLGCYLEDVTNLLATELEALLLPFYVLHLVDGHHKLLAPTLA